MMAPRRRANAASSESKQHLVTKPKAKATASPPVDFIRVWAVAPEIPRRLAILQLAALSEQVCELGLSPVYGSIPSSNKFPTSLSTLFVWLISLLTYQGGADMTGFLPLLGYLPAIVQPNLFRYSASLGPHWGPLITSVFTSYPIMFLALLDSNNCFAGAMIRNFPDRSGKPKHIKSGSLAVITIIVACLIQCLFLVFEKNATLAVAGISYTTAGVVSSRYGSQAVAILLWMTIARSYKVLILGILPLLYAILFVHHMPLTHNTASTNTTLQPTYALLARQESLTGYISVLDNVKEGFRVMRCDHSLLGGEWINKPAGHPAILNEPIYSIFVMLEAVRLAETPSSRAMNDASDAMKKALIIGLGVGTAPTAFITNGIDTTTVEIDPVVHGFATQYFNLPKNHTSIIGDAVKVVEDLQAGDMNISYDYIIHDVFTGGAEPINLFTQEFLLGLKSLLNPEGTIAINYAGDLLLPSAISVIFTITSVFPNCRLYRETPAPVPMGADDFTNLVVFCRKTVEPFTFRIPNEADLLGSHARQQHLLPRIEVTNVAEMMKGKGRMINKGRTKWLEASQRRSAMGHWHVMRRVLPDIVWETW